MNCTPVLVGGEAVDDGGEDAAAVSAAADEEHGVLGVGEGAALVLPLSAGSSSLHQSGVWNHFDTANILSDKIE